MKMKDDSVDGLTMVPQKVQDDVDRFKKEYAENPEKAYHEWVERPLSEVAAHSMDKFNEIHAKKFAAEDARKSELSDYEKAYLEKYAQTPEEWVVSKDRLVESKRLLNKLDENNKIQNKEQESLIDD